MPLYNPPTTSTTQNVVSKTTTYTATTGDDVILVDTSGGAWTLTLYAASGNSGEVLTVKKTSSDLNALTIDANASETIDGSTTTTVNTQYESLRIICDGTNWHILERICDTLPVAYTPTFGAGFGTVSTSTFYSRRVRNCLEVWGKWTNGTVASNTASVSVGFNGSDANVTIDTGMVPTSGIIGTAQTSLASTTHFGVYPIAPTTNSTVIQFTVQNSTTGFGSGAQLGATISASGSQNSVHFIVPIVGWKS